MASQYNLDHVYMKMAIAMSTLSHGVRAKVGAVAVTNVGVVITGVNGKPKELGNVLEIKEYNPNSLDMSDSYPFLDDVGDYRLVTCPQVIHAEENVILKAAREGVSLIDSTFYITLSTCPHCASQLISLGVKRVVYLNDYRDTTGVDILKQSGIIVDKLEFKMMES